MCLISAPKVEVPKQKEKKLKVLRNDALDNYTQLGGAASLRVPLKGSSPVIGVAGNG